MIDIKFIRENAKLVEVKSAQKGYSPNIKKLLTVDEARRKIIEEVDKLRSDKKSAAEARDEKKGSTIKKDLKVRETELEKLNQEFQQLINEVPNLPKGDVPVGRDENENTILRVVGDKTEFEFTPKDHVDLGVSLDLIDIEKASKVSGSRQAYLKNELVQLEFALVNLALSTLSTEGFIPVIPPVLINADIVDGLGYPEYATGEGYKVGNQYLVGTAEHSIVPMHANDLINAKNLPLRYVGFSTAFRKEAGSYGRDTKGIFRVHQFDKVEMVSYVMPEDEDREHQFLLSLEERLVHQLHLPYRVVSICTGDLGFPTARKFDIETWIPSQEKYRETHSVSTNSDFQSRRLNIKYQSSGKKDYVSILNGTAFAIGRTLIAIMENYQQKDGSIKVPNILQKYTGFKKIPA